MKAEIFQETLIMFVTEKNEKYFVWWPNFISFPLLLLLVAEIRKANYTFFRRCMSVSFLFEIYSICTKRKKKYKFRFKNGAYKLQ